MGTRKTEIASTKRVRLFKVKRTGEGKDPRRIRLTYVLENRVTGAYVGFDEDQLFDAAELLDDLCDSIEDRNTTE